MAQKTLKKKKIKNSFLVDMGMYCLIFLRRASFLLMVDTMVVICFSHNK